MMHIDAIKRGREIGDSNIVIARKIFLSYPTSVFIDNEDREFDIVNSISEKFKVPIMNIQVAGSAKTGLSLFKNSMFNSKYSDLDIAIIDSNLFNDYTEHVFLKCNGFKDLSKFERNESGESNYNQYKNNIIKGIFRPDLMPSSERRLDWHIFFGQLSSKNRDLFKSINAGIFKSQVYYENKRSSDISSYNSFNPL